MKYILYKCLDVIPDKKINYALEYIKINIEHAKKYFEDDKVSFEEAKTTIARTITEIIRKFPFKQPYKSHEALSLDKSDTTDDHILPPQHIVEMMLDDLFIKKYIYSKDNNDFSNALNFSTQTIMLSKKEHNKKIPKARRTRSSKKKYIITKTLNRLKNIKLFCSDKKIKSYVDDKSFYPAYFTEDFKNDLIKYDAKLFKVRPLNIREEV